MRYYIFVVLVGLLSACKSQTGEMTEKIKKLYGQKIEFTNQDTYVINGKDTILNTDDKCEFKVVIFADSIGCQPCNLRLGEIGLNIREMKLINNRVCFRIIVQNSHYEEFEHNASHEMPNFPFIYDRDALFLKKNNLPLNDNRFHSFLLDMDDKIILVGSPLGNDKLRKLYKERTMNHK